MQTLARVSDSIFQMFEAERKKFWNDQLQHAENALLRDRRLGMFFDPQSFPLQSAKTLQSEYLKKLLSISIFSCFQGNLPGHTTGIQFILKLPNGSQDERAYWQSLCTTTNPTVTNVDVHNDLTSAPKQSQSLKLQETGSNAYIVNNVFEFGPTGMINDTAAFEVGQIPRLKDNIKSDVETLQNYVDALANTSTKSSLKDSQNTKLLIEQLEDVQKQLSDLFNTNEKRLFDSVESRVKEDEKCAEDYSAASSKNEMSFLK